MRIFLFQDHFSKHRKELVAVGLPISSIVNRDSRPRGKDRYKQNKIS